MQNYPIPLAGEAPANLGKEHDTDAPGPARRPDPGGNLAGASASGWSRPPAHRPPPLYTGGQAGAPTCATGHASTPPNLLPATMTRLSAPALAAAALAFSLAAIAPGIAQAQNNNSAPTRVRATVTATHDGRIDVTDQAGNRATVAIAPDATISEVAPIEPAAIRPGSYIGTAAVTQPDGTLRALEVHVFPESMRGTGDGHRPYDLGADSTMTNGTVEQAGAVTGMQGRTLSVRYRGGEQRIVVPPEVPIVTFAPGRREALKAGAHVILFVRADTQGTLTAQRVLVGKDGSTPPM